MDLTTEEMQQLNQGHKTIMIIFMAMFCSLGVYLAVNMFITTEVSIQSRDLPVDLLSDILHALAVADLVVAFLLRRFMLKRTVQVQTRNGQHPATARYMVIVLISQALCQSIVIYGLVLSLLSQQNTIFYPFLALAAMGMLFFMPRKAELFSLAQRLKNPSNPSASV